MMDIILKHAIDYTKIAEGLGLSVEDTKHFFKDGRVIGRLGEFIYASETHSKRSKSEKAAYDVDSKDGKKVEVRSINNCIAFPASKQIGSKRQVTKKGFKEKLDSIDYYIGIDYRNLNELNLIRIDKDEVIDMDKKGMLTKKKELNANKLYKLIKK